MQKEIEAQQLIEPSFERMLLQSEAIFSGTVTLREVLKKEGTDSVGLLDIPVNFEVRDLGNATGYIASFPEDQASFGGAGLANVLKGAKPIREGKG